MKDSSTALSHVVKSNKNGVTTLRMNSPKTLNAWSESLMDELFGAMSAARNDPECKVLIVTGTGSYYCAGVDLGGAFKPMHPDALYKMIARRNERLFDNFLNFSKPIIAAVNGAAIGAAVTSAALCDAVIAADNATFSTPFARLGITPEGCSSFLFPRLLGSSNAKKMLSEGWVPTASEAHQIGLVTQVVSPSRLVEAAQDMAESWIVNGVCQLPRTALGYSDFDFLRAVNKEESLRIAERFLSEDFLEAQYNFLSSRGKTQQALMFKTLKLTRPMWSRMVNAKL